MELANSHGFYYSSPVELHTKRRRLSPLIPPQNANSSSFSRKLTGVPGIYIFRSFLGAGKSSDLQQPGGKMVVELVGAFNDVTDRMPLLSSGSSCLLFKTLKLSIPLLLVLPLGSDNRSPLSKALAVACILADLEMGAEVISAGIMREVLEGDAITMDEIKTLLGRGIVHLLHEFFRVREIPSRAKLLDDNEDAATLRKFCLTYYDVRALILELSRRLDIMRHLDHLPRYQQQLLSLDILRIYSPLAHAIGTGTLSLELEDLAFRYLFPHSYSYLDAWLRSHEAGKKLIDECKEMLLQTLKDDPILELMVDDISIHGRYKSRFSTMKKLLKDGRKPEEVHDILGLRVILNPRFGSEASERGVKACYRTCEVIRGLWKEIPNRTKDYISKPKANGYESLHMAVDLSDDSKRRPPMEIQIRTREMDAMASGGIASHSLYKGGLTDPEEVKRLKALMMAATDLAALHLNNQPTSQGIGSLENEHRNQIFNLFDKNENGRISIEELREVMEELGAEQEDAIELMQLVDSNSDGSLSSDEFDWFQRQVRLLRNLEDRDDKYRSLLGEKLPFLGDGTNIS
ncbi:probable GTP diphosphokinase CRSH, chloroplastic [Amborella trichopoda]|uniref:GTP diphosphokinase n=1 Tax=Amborella trichopoda TaxID=13333 RepID=W1NWJ4_AMBTC|nr:probable GTP diphosphokinase CRSH, chloroplastic [Amborella trichopoda]ERN02012.1 hypothetical protein AMTR_s00045p00095180 [Amborella trichopoda]|eukprot:XP_006840337.1 probable GTP diphosphokinase CRSH, chloroplastic [Amborella trichopoda]